MNQIICFSKAGLNIKKISEIVKDRPGIQMYHISDLKTLFCTINKMGAATFDLIVIDANGLGTDLHHLIFTRNRTNFFCYLWINKESCLI